MYIRTYCHTPLNSQLNLFNSGNTNPRVVIVTRVLLSICQLFPDDMMGAASQSMANRLSNTYTNDGKFKVDSFTNEEKSYFIKTHVNELYPDTIIIYRDLNGPSDLRTSRIADMANRYKSISVLLNMGGCSLF